jgi:superfamily II DNA/RNA helicase
LLVATDVAARGIHIDELSLVINYDVPIEKDSYVHRIGRTGRAGHGGHAITLVTGEDIMSLYEIEEHIGALIAEAELPSEAVSNEHRASVEKWIQANSQKRKSPRATSESSLRETQKKRTHTNSPQHHDKHKDRSFDVNMDHKTAKRVNTVHPADQVKPIYAIAKPIPTHATEADAVYAKRSTGIVQSQDSTTKKSFLQRVLQRIFGK